MTGEETPYHSRRIILKHSPGEAEVQSFADELGWPRRMEEPADIEQRSVHEVLWFAGPEVVLRYAEDPVSQHSYVEARANRQTLVDALCALAEERLDAWQEEELLESIGATDPMSRAEAVIRAGLASPEEFDDRFFSRINAAMSDPDHRVREAGIYATTFTVWPQYLPALRNAAENDPNEDRRRDARLALDLFRSEGIGS